MLLLPTNCNNLCCVSKISLTFVSSCELAAEETATEEEAAIGTLATTLALEVELPEFAEGCPRLPLRFVGTQEEGFETTRIGKVSNWRPGYN